MSVVDVHCRWVLMLSEAIKQGLDFEQALADPDLPELVTSTQVR